jgi:hypothetical protein
LTSGLIAGLRSTWDLLLSGGALDFVSPAIFLCPCGAAIGTSAHVRAGHYRLDAAAWPQSPFLSGEPVRGLLPMPAERLQHTFGSEREEPAMSKNSTDSQRLANWEADEIAAAARDAAAIGGRAGDEGLDPAQRPLIEGGEGVAEGFELAEEDLIHAAEHTDDEEWDPTWDAFPAETNGGRLVGVYGEADAEASSEMPETDR